MIAARVASKLVIDQLGVLGYRYLRETKSSRMYRKGTHIIPVTKKASMFDDTARSILRQCGMKNEDELNAFMKTLAH